MERCRQYGAEVIVHGRDIGEAKERALQMAKERDLVYVNGYDDPRILAGQGTAALEVVSQMEQLGKECDAVVIPVGGGGLLAGMAVALKHYIPHVEVIVSCQKMVSTAVKLISLSLSLPLSLLLFRSVPLFHLSLSLSLSFPLSHSFLSLPLYIGSGE